ncbi:FAD-dependent oxidoreductase, partial [Desulfosporosinus sp.]|uniref:FAD-dependent oxidoreductase n=1 Tax=Desulfosporosinus sp. TaxID=157907 RepID=UPI0026359266
MMSELFDVIVIGGGPGGYTAAAKASSLGGKVALVERGALGGTCLNQGCIPTKTLLKSTEVLEIVKKAKDFGVDISQIEVSLEKMQGRKQTIIKRLNAGVEFLMKNNKIQIFRGEGKITGTDEVTISNLSEQIVLKTRNIIIATGSQPAAIPGLEPEGHWIMNSDHALRLSTIPTKLLIIGGGAIGVEFASIYQKLGAQVTLVEAMDRILPFSDGEVSNALKQLMTREKIVVLTETKVVGIHKS